MLLLIIQFPNSHSSGERVAALFKASFSFLFETLDCKALVAAELWPHSRTAAPRANLGVTDGAHLVVVCIAFSSGDSFVGDFSAPLVAPTMKIRRISLTVNLAFATQSSNGVLSHVLKCVWQEFLAFWRCSEICRWRYVREVTCFGHCRYEFWLVWVRRISEGLTFHARKRFALWSFFVCGDFVFTTHNLLVRRTCLNGSRF